ncbi:hypothetical protein Tco_1127165 [Tanacetum coccineum]
MTTTVAQQVALDNALVPLEKRVEIGKYSMRIDPVKTKKEPTYQVVLDALALTTCYPAFLITTDVPEIYMHQFWFTINKKDSTLYRFKIDKKRTTLNMEIFREIFQIYPRLPTQEFDALPSDKDIVSFIKELGHEGDIKSITEVVIDHMYQHWRTFASIINKCLSGKITGLDKLRLSRAQILWGRFYKKNVDFVELLWEDFTFQIENKDHKNILGIMRFVSKSEDFQIYGAILPNRMTNQQIQDSDAYKTYLAYAISVASPKMKRKLKKPASPSKKRTLITIEEEEPEPAKKDKPTKKPATKDSLLVFKSKTLLVYLSLLKEAQLKKALKKRKRETTIHQAGGSSEGADFKSEVHDEPKGNDKADEQSDDDHEQADGERIEFDDEEEETQDDEAIGDVNVRLADDKPDDEDKGDKEMTNAETKDVEHVNVNQEGAGNQVKDDAHATQKTEGLIPSSFISSDYAAKYLNFDNIPLVDTGVVSMLDINVQHEVPRTLPLLTILVFVIPEHTIANPPKIVTTTSSTAISSLMSSLFPHLQQLTLISTPTTTEATTSTTTVSESETLVALQLRVTNLEKDVKELKDVDNSPKVISTIQSEVSKAVKEYLGSSQDYAMHKVIQKNVADIIKEHFVPAETVERLRQKQDDADKDEGPSAGSDRGLNRWRKDTKPSKKAKPTETSKGTFEFKLIPRFKRRKTSKDTEPSKKTKSTETSKGTFKSQPKSSSKSAQTEETVFEAGDTQELQNQG